MVLHKTHSKEVLFTFLFSSLVLFPLSYNLIRTLEGAIPSIRWWHIACDSGNHVKNKEKRISKRVWE